MDVPAPTPVATIRQSIIGGRRDEVPWFDSFRPVRVWASGANFTIRVQPGYVQEVIAQSGVDCWVNHPVYYSGSVLTDSTDIAVTSGHTVVVTIHQDSLGRVITTAGPPDKRPTLSVVAAPAASAHWYPTDPAAAGSDGTLVVPLYSVTNVGGVAAITNYHWGPIVVRGDLWQGVNLGTGKQVFKEHAETLGPLYRFRSLTAGSGITLVENADDIEISTTVHPYKVSSNGPNVMDIEAGFYFALRSTSPDTYDPFYWVPHAYAGATNLTVSNSGDSYVYLDIALTEVDVYQDGASPSDRTFVRTATTTPFIVQSTSDPTMYTGSAAHIYIPIAKINMTASVVTVVSQYLTHNPYIGVPGVIED